MKLSSAIIEALQNQIRNELVAFYTYMHLANWCDTNGFPGSAHWLKVQCQEELGHVWKIQEFLVDIGVQIHLQDIPAPKHALTSLKEVFTAAKIHEEKVTKNFYDMMEIAQREHDYAALPLIHWFLSEQIEEEKNVQSVLDMLDRIPPQSGGLLYIDKELGKRS